MSEVKQYVRLEIFLLGFFFLFALQLSNAQNCTRTESKCPKPDKTYKVSSSSRAFKIRKGKHTRIVTTLYGGRKYYFSTYSKNKVGDLQFRIISASSKQVLYDNSTENLTNEKVLDLKLTQKLFIEIVAPNWKSDEVYECAAFLIAYKDN